jgi:DNA-binding response OmpR family regulator
MKILVVDDDRDLLGILAFAFRRAGYLVLEAGDGEQALRLIHAERPDLVVLDVNLPRLSGFEVCQRVRQTSNVPILMLTVRSEESDVVHGLDLGADDYMAKPFSPQTLLARVRALLRRAALEPPHPAAHEVEVGDLRLDTESRMLSVRDREPVPLTKLEFRLLQFLAARAGQVIPTERLWSHIWGNHGGDRQLLKQLVHRVRRKVEDDPASPRYLVTAPGVGYRLVTTAAAVEKQAEEP